MRYPFLLPAPALTLCCSLVKAHGSRVSELELSLDKAERSRKTVEIELQAVRQRHLEASDALDAASRDKDGLEKQLAAANVRFQDMEDATLKIERERSAWARQVDDLKSRLDAESAKRTQLERSNRQLDTDLIAHKQAVGEHEKNAATLRKELNVKSQELAKAISLQDTTIVEHVHVLEEAKRYTDRQLVEAQGRVQELSGYIRQLERTNTRLKGEGEDLARELQVERAGQRKANAAAATDAQVQKAVEKERKGRENAEAQGSSHTSQEAERG